MRHNGLFYLLVVGVPALAIAYFFLTVTTVVVLHNAGSRDTEVSMVISGDHSIERTPAKQLKSNSYTLILFNPQTDGDLAVNCVTDGHRNAFALGRETPSKFSVYDVAIDSCDRVSSRRGFSL